MTTKRQNQINQPIDRINDFGDWNEVRTSRTKLYARWVKVDGKLMCEWISE
ncbi:hypothetical protein Pse7367_1973 [Thalassoporum mexicanum PCC 7367]|uniref:hypothetical protein n=1 Tax=Thalassoporum mexicanum TaxID=3457544 RepID=UPI00029F9E73|nr:hypothetical protein [Pseudanabaena sp. PCC 7367]AFY70247.1 hypothetical protein Pse7367_1973 [Pseudanabaena sp. PCC 7367]